MKLRSFLGFFISLCLVYAVIAKDTTGNESDEDDEEEISPRQKEYYKYLIKRLKESADSKKAEKNRAVPLIYEIPGPFEPLPGRTHNGDYWPVFPFSNQYSGGVDLDPSISRHIGGDLNIPVPSWGMMDITGHFFNRISDTTTKFGYLSHPVNMLGLDKNDFATLVSDPRTQANRYLQPSLPLGKVPRTNVPMSCKPPMCNPYTGTFAFGLDHDIGGHDGNDGDINIPFPVSKGVAYRFPFGGNYYYDLDNITVSYGHNISPLDPFANPYFFNNEYSRRRELLPPEPDVFPRTKRNVIGYIPVVLTEVPEAETSRSTKVTPNDFHGALRAPPKGQDSLGSLRRIMKRDTEPQVEETGLEVKKVVPRPPSLQQMAKSESLYGQIKSFLGPESGQTESGGDKNDSGGEENTFLETRTQHVDTNRGKMMRMTLEKIIIPAEMFEFQPRAFPQPLNQGYLNPFDRDSNSQAFGRQNQPIFYNLDPPPDQYYGPTPQWSRFD